MKKLSFILIILIFISSCTTESSDDVQVSAIYQSYLLSFDITGSETMACAQFRDGGALGNDVILNSPSSITLNGEVLVHQNVGYELYYHYYKSFAGEQKVATFVFTDKNNTSYTNSADLNSLSIIGFPAGLDTIPKSADYVFAWVGGAVQADEDVELRLFSADTSFVYSPMGSATSLTIPETNLSAFQEGMINMSLTRQRKDNLQASTGKGGHINLEYSSNQDCYIKN